MYVPRPIELLDSRNFFFCLKDEKEADNKRLVRPILEYGSSVWDPHFKGLND